MNIPLPLKQSETIADMVCIAKKIARLPNKVTKLVSRKKIIKNYLAANAVRKLLIGSGPTVLDGWLSTDKEPESDSVIYLDATKQFPFDDNTFDYIFSEHMIEHIPWQDGIFMLGECRRIMKPGGAIRIGTPDLAVLIGMYTKNGNPLNEKFTEWISSDFPYSGEKIDILKPAFVINNAFHNWGHQFLYDGELLAMAMDEAGFTDIRRCAWAQSEDPNLSGIERHGQNENNEEMVEFETMIFEGRCPAKK